MTTAWRPCNETPADLDRESEILTEVAAYLGGLRWVKLSEALYGIDAAMFDGDSLTCWVEAKHRTAVYDPVLLSFAKLMCLVRHASMSKRPAYFALRNPDGLHLHRVGNPQDYAVRLVGNARGQPGDLEPCAMIGLKLFTSIRR